MLSFHAQAVGKVITGSDRQLVAGLGWCNDLMYGLLGTIHIIIECPVEMRCSFFVEFMMNEIVSYEIGEK